MNEDQIRGIIEQVDSKGDMSQGIVEELIQALKSVEVNPANIKASSKDIEEQLKIELETEQDWRKRAAIAAKIISLGLE